MSEETPFIQDVLTNDGTKYKRHITKRKPTTTKTQWRLRQKVLRSVFPKKMWKEVNPRT